MGKFSNIDLSSKEIAEKYGLRASDVVEITNNFLQGDFEKTDMLLERLEKVNYPP